MTTTTYSQLAGGVELVTALKTHIEQAMKFTLQSGYIQCSLTFRKYEHILSKQSVLALHTLCIFIPVLTACPSPFLIHTPLTLVLFVFLIYSLFSSANPEGLSTDIKKENERVHAHTKRLPSELSPQGAGEKQWEAWSISDSNSSGWKIERGRTGKRGGQRVEE